MYATTAMLSLVGANAAETQKKRIIGVVIVLTSFAERFDINNASRSKH